MQIQVKLFALARDVAGVPEIPLEIPAGATVAALREAIVNRLPALARLMPHVQIALDSRYAAEDDTIGPQTEVAVIPPVSGG
jgi:molybdopterin converting factor subunit 1